MELLSSAENVPFFVALAVMLGILAMELLGSMIGASLSSFLESGFDLDVDAEAGLEIDGGDGGSALSRVLSWLRVGEVPVLMLLVVFLTSFGLVGLVGQSMLHGLLGVYAPSWLMAVPAFVLALPCTRTFGGLIAWLVPKDETTAISEVALVGRVAVMTLATARAGEPAEAKTTDLHGQVHYLRVEPDEEGVELERGAEVLLVAYDGTHYRGIRNVSSALSD
jgi:hypothetical protein